METRDSKPQRNSQILEEAADWLIEFSADGSDVATRQRFGAWLRASPEHIRAYLEMLPIWEDGAIPPLHPDGGPEALIALARAADNVVALVPKMSETRPTSVGSEGWLRRRHVALAASVVLAGVIVSSGSWFYLARQPTYSTVVGEQRSIDLPDGSIIELNARSRVRLRFSDQERDVDLLEGQALFRVAKNPARPFIVTIDGAQVRAVGTQFDVYRRTTGTTVTVLEGRVSVARSKSNGSAAHGALLPANDTVFVSPGEQVTVSAQTTQAPVRVNVAAATAWVQRRMIFDAATLATVVEEFNRYNTRRLAIRDVGLESFPITASFSSTDPESLIRFLQAQPGISVAESADELQISVRH